MRMICERCGQKTAMSGGRYVYDRGGMTFACRACAHQMEDEVRCARKICAAVNGKKAQAARIAKDPQAAEDLLQQVEKTLLKIPDVGNLRAELPLLAALVRRHVAGEGEDIPLAAIVAAVATLLYVIAPIDLVPDLIPGAGYSDDAMAVSLCLTTLQRDPEQFNAWLAPDDV